MPQQLVPGTYDSSYNDMLSGVLARPSVPSRSSQGFGQGAARLLAGGLQGLLQSAGASRGSVPRGGSLPGYENPYASSMPDFSFDYKFPSGPRPAPMPLVPFGPDYGSSSSFGFNLPASPPEPTLLEALEKLRRFNQPQQSPPFGRNAPVGYENPYNRPPPMGAPEGGLGSLARDLAHHAYLGQFAQPGFTGIGSYGLATGAKMAPGLTTAARSISSRLPGHAGRAAFANSPGLLGHAKNVYTQAARAGGQAATWGSRARGLGAVASGASLPAAYGLYAATQAPQDVYDVATGKVNLQERTSDQLNNSWLKNIGQNLLRPGLAGMQYLQSAVGSGLDKGTIFQQMGREWFRGNELDKQIAESNKKRSS